MLKDKAIEYFKSGFSCSESIVKAAVDFGLCDKAILPCATSFSGGMSSGCLCGAIAGAQLVAGFNFGRCNSKNNDVIARNISSNIVEKFKEKHKITCCKALSAGLDGMQRKEHCSAMVGTCCDILEEILMIGAKND